MSKTTDSLRELAEDVETQQDLARFIGRLHEDLNDHPEDWPNAALGSYLEAMSGWVQDMDGYFSHTGQDLARMSPYKLFAQILLASAHYE
jgi:hypothetical protein